MNTNMRLSFDFHIMPLLITDRLGDVSILAESLRNARLVVVCIWLEIKPFGTAFFWDILSPTVQIVEATPAISLPSSTKLSEVRRQSK